MFRLFLIFYHNFAYLLWQLASAVTVLLSKKHVLFDSCEFCFYLTFYLLEHISTLLWLRFWWFKEYVKLLVAIWVNGWLNGCLPWLSLLKLYQPVHSIFLSCFSILDLHTAAIYSQFSMSNHLLTSHTASETHMTGTLISYILSPCWVTLHLGFEMMLWNQLTIFP